MSSKRVFTRFNPDESEFSHRYAAWANNHRGWQKMKRKNRRIAKRRFNKHLGKEEES